MYQESLHTDADLREMQSRTLGDKIQTSFAKIMETLVKFDKKVYVSFSGGKDSTVLADLVAKCCEMFNCKLVLWFSDTGLEYPEVREHVKKFADWLREKYNIEVELVIDYPKDISPLAKPHRNNPRLTERFETRVNGWEIANAFSELSDPIDQRHRFELQMQAKAQGDGELPHVFLRYQADIPYFPKALRLSDGISTGFP